MKADPRKDIFKRGKKIDLPSPGYEAVAGRLEDMGLLKTERYTYVRCVNPLDPDQQYLKDISCAGRVILHSELDEDDHDFHCPDCGRVVFPSRKQKFQMMKVNPRAEAIRSFVRGQLDPLGVDVREDPVGLFRLSGRSGEVQVALADYCREASVFHKDYPFQGKVVFVTGNERDFGRHVPKDAPRFHLLDLADGDAGNAFRRELRRLLRLDDPHADAPAVLGIGGLPVPAVSRKKATQDPYPGVTRIPTIPGTTWSQVEIYFVDGETLAIRVPGRKMERHTHGQLGMANKNNGKPTKLWELLLQLCDDNGHIFWNDAQKRFNAFKERVSKLRPLLQHIFGIKADPFPTCSRKEGLRAAFRAFPDLPKEPYVGEDKWDDL